ncbi:MAG: hypothetical protein AB1Z98_35925 [Nannocystaceae bacterium]
MYGPDYAAEVISSNGEVSYRYYIATEEQVTFETYDGLVFDVYLWGADDCEGELPTKPPGS